MPSNTEGQAYKCSIMGTAQRQLRLYGAAFTSFSEAADLYETSLDALHQANSVYSCAEIQIILSLVSDSSSAAQKTNLDKSLSLFLRVVRIATDSEASGVADHGVCLVGLNANAYQQMANLTYMQGQEEEHKGIE